MDRVYVVVAAFQEAAVVRETLEGLLAQNLRVVLVDDGSTDDTAAIGRRCNVAVVRHRLNLGQGAALQTGIDFALRQGAGYIATFDADGQHEPRAVREMVALAKTTGADVILGSRFLGTTVGMSAMRRMVLSLAIMATRFQTRLNVSDTHNGLRLFTRAAAERIRIRQPGMAHASEILETIARERLTVREIPATIRYTDYSKRKGQRLSQSIRIAFDLVYAAWSR